MSEYKFFSDWFKELKRIASAAGLPELVGAYHFHVDSYRSGLTPKEELVKLVDDDDNE